jgi:FHA domain
VAVTQVPAVVVDDAAAPPLSEPLSEPEPAAPSEPEPEPEPDVQPEPEALPEPEPELVSPVEPAPDPGPEAQPEPEIEVDLEPDVPDAAGDGDLCAQCGQRFEQSDIFCAECGFVRPRPESVVRPHDTVAYDPFPWGLPRSTEHAPVNRESSAAAPGPAEPAEIVDAAPPAPVVAAVPASFPPVESDFSDMEKTRIVTGSLRKDRFVLQFSTGESVTVFGTGMVGRHPLAEPGEYFDTFVTIVDPGKSVSKTHVEFGQEAGNFWVSDRFSGNGTVVREPDALPRRCEPGKRYRIARGTRVEIGEQFFIVS